MKAAIRMTFSPDELRSFYSFLGGEIGRLRDLNAIEDGRPSEIAMKVAGHKHTQDRIADALSKAEEPEKTPAAQPPNPNGSFAAG